MTSIIIISGGNSYTSYDQYLDATRSYPPRFKDGLVRWKTNLMFELSGLYEVLVPVMPCADNAKFEEWKIVFEKVLEISDTEIILIGHSLGANFLQTYLGQTTIQGKNLAELHFVAGCISEGDFVETSNWTNISTQTQSIHIWHSDDDPVVDISESAYYHSKLAGSTFHALSGRKHFNQQYFPELSAHLINRALVK